MNEPAACIELFDAGVPAVTLQKKSVFEINRGLKPTACAVILSIGSPKVA